MIKEENLFRNKFKTNSLRLSQIDYSSSGHYFFTICTKDRVNYFGKISNNFMCINEDGTIVHNTWKKIPNYFKNILLDEIIIMPNHVHGIIQIQNNNLIDGRDVIGRNEYELYKFRRYIRNNPKEWGGDRDNNN